MENQIRLADLLYQLPSGIEISANNYDRWPVWVLCSMINGDPTYSDSAYIDLQPNSLVSVKKDTEGNPYLEVQMQTRTLSLEVYSNGLAEHWSELINYEWRV